MTGHEEAAYSMGGRAAWRAMLGECLRQLDAAGDPDAGRLRWVKEREDVVARLRILCAHHGDNDWDETLYLADVIDKHLGDYLEARDDGRS